MFAWKARSGQLSVLVLGLLAVSGVLSEIVSLQRVAENDGKYL